MTIPVFINLHHLQIIIHMTVNTFVCLQDAVESVLNKKSNVYNGVIVFAGHERENFHHFLCLISVSCTYELL